MSQQALAIGDPMTIGERHFHVTELTPLAAPAGAAVAGKTGHQLMLVVATEVGDETAKPAPRRLRFLIEGIAPAVSAPASTGTAGGSQGTL